MCGFSGRGRRAFVAIVVRATLDLHIPPLPACNPLAPAFCPTYRAAHVSEAMEGKKMVATSSNAHDRRVASYSTRSAAFQIEYETHERLSFYASRPDLIDDRLSELSEEWDMERTLEANASSLILASTAAGFLFDKRFLLLTGAVAGFLLMHAVQGFCPPVPLLRKMGVRTRSEIMYEQQSLLMIQRDFMMSGLLEDDQSVASRPAPNRETAKAAVGSEPVSLD
jgi:hypothetical protein